MVAQESAGFDATEASQEILRQRSHGPEGPTTEDKLKADFRLFLIVVWRHLGLPDPTPLQLSMAWWLQHSPQRTITMGFRGVGKSWITAAFALWLLYCDPDKKVLVVSGSLKRAVAFTNFCLNLIREMPLLKHLRPKPHQRQSGQAFDVGPAKVDQNPSFHAAGISSNLPGFRADAIIPDDVETNTNSITVLMREKIRDGVKEFDSILKPDGIVRFLGTPHDYDSLYMHLSKRGYTIRIYPGEYPTDEKIRNYGSALAPYILDKIKKNKLLVGTPTEPTRFTAKDLAARRLSLGSSEYALQFMLDTTLADKDRYPLKLQDLIISGLDPRRAPDLVSWGNSKGLILQTLPCLGFEGDFYFGPANSTETFTDYNKIVAAIDSSGRGKDETAIAIIAELNGILYLLHCSGYRDGYSPATLRSLAKILVRFRVHRCVVESNFGDGMFINLLAPYVIDEWDKFNKASKRKDDHGGTEMEEVRSAAIQKEQRILSLLEPLTQQHRLVVSTEVIEEDYASASAAQDGEEAMHRYSLMYQWTHITRERDCLTHDDRIEAVSMAAAEFADVIGVLPAGMAQQREDERLEAELEALFEDADEVGNYTRTPKRIQVGSMRPANLIAGHSLRG